MNHMYGDLSNLNAPYDAIPLQGLGQPFQTPDDPKYPWLQESQDTLVLQQDLNEGLTSQGGCLLAEDGKLGPRTCGALQHFGENVQTCLNHAPESPPILPEVPCKSGGGGGGGAQPAPSPEEELVKAGSSGVPGWAIGLGLGALAIVAVMMMKGKKKR